MNSRGQNIVIQQPECDGYIKVGFFEGCLGDFSTLHLILILSASGLLLIIWKSPSIIKELKWYKFRQRYYDFRSVMEKKFYRKK
jgi:hypothetical protein